MDTITGHKAYGAIIYDPASISFSGAELSRLCALSGEHDDTTTPVPLEFAIQFAILLETTM